MPSATVLFRSGLAYRRDAFCAGLARQGYTITDAPKRSAEPDDVLVIWNRKGREAVEASRYEARGARVVVAENGYVGTAPGGGKLYALALGQHNGAGQWNVGGPERWDALGLEIAPWRSAGSFIVLLPQRGIGIAPVAMPRQWPSTTFHLAKKLSGRDVRIRWHPGKEKVEPYADLRGAHLALTWASGAAIKAMVAGVPVIYGLEGWIGAQGGTRLMTRDTLDKPVMGDRLAMLRRLAWAQWSIAEIESGEAFAWLLGR